jgi:hypothetical protein
MYIYCCGGFVWMLMSEVLREGERRRRRKSG